VNRKSNSTFSRNKLRIDGRNGYTIDERMASEIKWLLFNTNMIQREIAKIYGSSYSAISAIKNGHSWAHVTQIKPTNIAIVATE
jgi:hypothetical protein